jgi:hypothetical protein
LNSRYWRILALAPSTANRSGSGPSIKDRFPPNFSLAGDFGGRLASRREPTDK